MKEPQYQAPPSSPKGMERMREVFARNCKENGSENSVDMNLVLLFDALKQWQYNNANRENTKAEKRLADDDLVSGGFVPKKHVTDHDSSYSNGTNEPEELKTDHVNYHCSAE